MQESFFTQAPYKYRPSIAGYLTNMKVDLNSMIADVLYLDKKNKINITKYTGNEIRFEIKSKADLAYSEDFLISILEHEHKNNTFDLNRLKKHVTVYESSIIKEMQGQFNLNLGLAQMKGILPHVFLGIATNIVLGWITGICSIFFFPIFFIIPLFTTYPTTASSAIAFLLFAILYVGVFLAPYAVILFFVRKKLKKSALEKKYLFKNFFLELVKLYFISLLSIPIMIFFIGAIFFPPLALIPIAFYAYFYYKYGIIAKKFLLWYKESEKATEHRINWLKFKDFVIIHSEVEKRPIKYYEMWDEFYYYTLATGAIKEPFKD